MIDDIRMLLSRHTYRYTLFGVLFGVLFPLGAEVLGAVGHLRIHSDPLFYVILTAPFFLGVFAYGAGRRQDELSKFHEFQAQLLIDETAFYRSAMDQSAIIAFTDPFGRITYVNDQFVRISGYSREELIGRDHRIINSGRMTKDFFREMWATISSGTSWRGEICNKAKDGSLYWVDTSIVPMLGSKGKVIRYVSIRYEITARKRMEEELWTNNEMQRAMLESVNYGVISANTDGVIQTFNAVAEKMLGYRAEEIIGRKTPEIFHDADEVAARAAQLSAELKTQISPGFETFTAKAKLGCCDEHEWTYIRKDGSRYPVRLSITAMKKPSGEIFGFLGVAIDITRSRQAAEELLRSKEAAVSAVKVKAEFLANMSHEIRTPMNGIIGMTNLLLARTNDADQTEKLRIIQSCGTSLLDLVNDILDFSKLEAEKLDLEHAAFELRSMIKDVVGLFGQRAIEKNLMLSSSIESSVPEWLIGDVTRVRQVLTNLVNNALKFTEKGGVKISVMAIKKLDGRHLVQFSVQDTGMGISPEVRDKIFASFAQADASTTRKYGGTGLGLVISKALCEKMGGSIWVESELGKGSIFYFSFLAGAQQAPKRSQKTNELSSSVTSLGKTHPLRILVVEDNRVNQLVAVGILEQLGYSADVANNGRESIEMVERAEYDLILMDCQMPEMDGFEATQNIIKKFKGRRRPRIVALTASMMKTDVDRCLGSGMDDCLSKPIVVDSIVQTLKKAGSRPFDKKRFVSYTAGVPGLDKQLVISFFESLSILSLGVEEALSASDPHALEWEAHRLKGMLLNFYAEPAAMLAAKLEEEGRQRNLANVKSYWSELKDELEQLKIALDIFLNEKCKS